MKRSWLRRKVASKVTVHTSDGVSFDGHIDAVYADGVTLRAVTLLGDPDQNTKDAQLPGVVWLPRDTIAFVQAA
jgi:hypothetical protein